MAKLEKARKRLLIIDDNEAKHFASVVQAANLDWEVNVEGDWESEVKKLTDSPEAKPGLISVDLGLPPYPHDVKVGLDVLYRLRAADATIPLVVHSVHIVDEPTIREIIGAKASFVNVQTEPQIRSFARLVPAFEAGYIVCCGTAAIKLKQCLKPDDPLKPAEWALIRSLAHSQSVEEIAQSLGANPKTINTQIKNLAHYLESKGKIELADPRNVTSGHRYKPALVRFFMANCAKFGRCD